MATLLLLLTLHGLFLAALLGGYGRRHDRANGVLAALVLTASLLLFETYLRASGTVVRWPHLRGVLQPAWMAVGPLSLLYVRRFLGLPRRSSEIWLALPTLVAVVWMTPYYLQPAESKLTGPANPGGAAGSLTLYTAFWLLTGWCALRSRTAVRRAQTSDTAGLDEAPWRRAWLRWLMGAMALYAALDCSATLFFIVRGHYPVVAGYVTVILLSSIVYAVGLLVVMPDGLLAARPWPGKRYQRSEIPEGVVERHLARLDRLMTEDKPWLEDGLGLEELAGRLGMTRHHLSQLMSQHVGSSFTDYVNGFRVEEAQRLLCDMGSRKSILDVGLEAGFGSSATFYRAFKKHVGATPKEFLGRTASSNVEPIARSHKL